MSVVASLESGPNGVFRRFGIGLVKAMSRLMLLRHLRS